MPEVAQQYGWIGFIDIAGFKNAMRDKDRYRTTASAYAQCIANLEKAGPVVALRVGEQVIELKYRTVVFSDSIFLFPDFGALPPRAEGLALYAAAVGLNVVVTTLLGYHLPSRGALVQGDFSLIGDSVVVGPAVVEAYEWEQQQRWLWFSVSPGSYSKAKQAIALLPERLKETLREHEVPTKGASKYTRSVTIRMLHKWDAFPWLDPLDIEDAMSELFEAAYENRLARPEIYDKWYETGLFHTRNGLNSAMRDPQQVTPEWKPGG